MKRKNCLAMLLAGGQGSRLSCLTASIAKPGISFGGKYRLIDFSLSNCVNSGIDTVGVLTQYKPYLLNAYVGTGSAWDLDNEQGGVHILPPYVGAAGGEWYKGTANAIYQNIDFISRYNPEYVLILSGDHIYKMDYSKMLDEHIKNQADATIAVLDIPLSEASRFGIMSCEEDGRITRFQEKPEKPESTLASMGIYIFTWSTLRAALEEDVAIPTSSNDFGKDVIPKLLADEKKLYSYRFDGYWKDVGTIPSYYEANMELLQEQPPLDLFDKTFRVFSKNNMLPPQYVDGAASVTNSLISNGCTVLGEVHNSILAPGVYIGVGTVVRDSILLPQCKIMGGTTIDKTIVGEKAVVEESCVLGKISEQEQPPQNNGITVVENDHFIPPFSIYEAGQIIENQGRGLNA